MASFAKIGLNSKVIEVLSVHNNELLDSNGVEQEVNGIDFITKLTGWSIWKQTSYNTHGGVHLLGGTPFRKNHASIGYTYNEDKDAFIPPKPFNSWILNETTCLWKAPISKPEFTAEQESQNTAETHYWCYVWNETTTAWDLTNSLI
tara:strand:+ start:178 stop:618 length:441 start_codon:yes stop_codon:yes gene_type:complete